MTLEELGRKHGTDKAHGGYLRLYDLLLSHRRHVARKVLELGVGSPSAMIHVVGYQAGASLRMWAEYFPQADIYGLDNDPATMVTGERIHTLVGSQAKLFDLQCVAALAERPFDLIVDDASHLPEDQVFSALSLRPFMAHGGLYIIEDVQEPAFVGQGVGPHMCVTFETMPGRRDCAIILVA